MTFDEYQEIAETTAMYPLSYKVIYPTLGLAGEAGEVAEKIKKIIRSNVISPWPEEDLKKELGDVLWYISAIATDLGLSLEEIAETNIDKLKSRAERGKIQGDGDNR